MPNFEKVKEEDIIQIPHDSMIFGMDAYEIQTVSAEVLGYATRTPGHYTVKLNPTLSKKNLHDYGFYYCDTLIEPFCSSEKFIHHQHNAIEVKYADDIDELISLSQNVFIYGRFHRDFNLANQLAENRYAHWLKQLYEKQNVYALYYEADLAGFIACAENKLVLHALKQKYKGQGLSKFFWSKLCLLLYHLGYAELLSSISAANLAAVNLYASLGFNFRNAVDVYHRLVR